MSKTTDNLKAAFAGESEARNKYNCFAEVARKEGYLYIAKNFTNRPTWMFDAAEPFPLPSGARDPYLGQKTFFRALENFHLRGA